MLTAIKERWSRRELERQIATGGALRPDGKTKKVSPVVSQIHPTALEELKDAYSLGAGTDFDASNVTDASGHYRIDGVPASVSTVFCGSQTIGAWTETTIVEGQTAHSIEADSCSAVAPPPRPHSSS